MYVATVLLNRTEAEFWTMTPKKVISLYRVWQIQQGIRKPKKVQADAYIDQIF